MDNLPASGDSNQSPPSILEQVQTVYVHATLFGSCSGADRDHDQPFHGVAWCACLQSVPWPITTASSCPYVWTVGLAERTSHYSIITALCFVESLNLFCTLLCLMLPNTGTDLLLRQSPGSSVQKHGETPGA